MMRRCNTIPISIHPIPPSLPSRLQDLKSKRNPRLVPYVLLDERTKKSNRDSLREAIRTLIGYGYNIEPSDQEGGEFSLKGSVFNIYRA